MYGIVALSPVNTPMGQGDGMTGTVQISERVYGYP